MVRWGSYHLLIAILAVCVMGATGDHSFTITYVGTAPDSTHLAVYGPAGGLDAFYYNGDLTYPDALNAHKVHTLDTLGTWRVEWWEFDGGDSSLILQDVGTRLATANEIALETVKNVDARSSPAYSLGYWAVENNDDIGTVDTVVDQINSKSTSIRDSLYAVQDTQLVMYATLNSMATESDTVVNRVSGIGVLLYPDSTGSGGYGWDNIDNDILDITDIDGWWEDNDCQDITAQDLLDIGTVAADSILKSATSLRNDVAGSWGMWIHPGALSGTDWLGRQVVDSTAADLATAHGSGSWESGDLGTGDETHIIHVRSSADSAAIQGARLKVYTTDYVTREIDTLTPTSGRRVLDLDAGSYIATASLNTAYNPDTATVTVIADQIDSTIIELSPIDLGAPSESPDKCRMRLWTADWYETAIDSLVVYTRPTRYPVRAGSYVFPQAWAPMDTTNSAGLAHRLMFRTSATSPNTTYEFMIQDMRDPPEWETTEIRRVTVPDSTEAKVTWNY